MKIACIADLHLNKTVYKGVMDKKLTSLPFRNADFMRSFEWMVDECINNIKPDLLVIGGDVYDYYDASNPIRSFFSSQLSKLVENKIPCIILVGNHDVSKKNHALEDVQKLNLKPIRVLDSSLIMNFKEHRLLFFPYSLDIEQQKITMRDAFKKFTREIKEDKSNLPSIFFGHFGVKNAILNDYSIENDNEDERTTNTTTTLINAPRAEYYSRRSDDIENTELDELGVEYVILGDFHRHQILKTKCYGFYPGSIEKTDINEVNQKKGFMVYDSDAEEIKDYGKCKFIEYPNCRPMIEIRGNLESIKKQFYALDYSKYQGAIVKIVFIGNSEELLDFSSGIEELKKEMVDKIDPIHVFTVPKPPRDKIQEQKATALEREIMERGHFTDKDILNVLKEMIEERVIDKEDRDETIKIANEIYNEVKEEV